MRDSVAGRRTLTPEQRADVRARIAQHLDRAPTLLVLDNCEHVVTAVADLVAFLVATTREPAGADHDPGAARDLRGAGAPPPPPRYDGRGRPVPHPCRGSPARRGAGGGGGPCRRRPPRRSAAGHRVSRPRRSG
ncbi:hypothetical protein [Nocardioides convexus]|uniref:hypothetical protein n=1 Tax=Nocardioides convexus TaxID=2712224 RepID=UPI002418AABE|nr:hypothetical protein [Nocardioides convexus]